MNPFLTAKKFLMRHTHALTHLFCTFKKFLWYSEIRSEVNNWMCIVYVFQFLNFTHASTCIIGKTAGKQIAIIGIKHFGVGLEHAPTSYVSTWTNIAWS